ncbi:MAG: DUF4292 domain-containing protein [Desulfobulbaceae bacterium]|nr:DUF4292 domain-containing protein [Desulfobulbaceae bacterium]
MIFDRRSLLFYFLAVLWSIFQAGCADKLPVSMPIAESQRGDIFAHYQSFRNNDCTHPIDADVSLDLNSFGRHLKAAGFLQLQPPSLLRTTIVDKVGRPLFILVTAGDAFTLVNSMKGEVFVGSAASIIRDREHPLDLQPEEVVSLLTGRFAPPVSFIRDVRSDQQSDTTVWLVFSLSGKNSHNILFEPESERIIRHIIGNDAGDILLDINYVWRDEKRGKCSLPDKIMITGAALDGEVRLKYDLIMLPPVLPEKTFELNLPEHYIIKRNE